MDTINSSSIKVSIIEDSEIHKIWFCEKISGNKRFQVVSQDSHGRTGIESVKLNKPDLILLDFQLPDITGIETAKRIKTYLINTKIIAITAHTEKAILRKIILDKNIDAIAVKGSHHFEQNFFSVLESIFLYGSYLDPSDY